MADKLQGIGAFGVIGFATIRKPPKLHGTGAFPERTITAAEEFLVLSQFTSVWIDSFVGMVGRVAAIDFQGVGWGGVKEVGLVKAGAASGSRSR